MVYPEFLAYYIIFIYTYDGELELMKYRGLSWQLGADVVSGLSLQVFSLYYWC
jgi:hypothetical protein